MVVTRATFEQNGPLRAWVIQTSAFSERYIRVTARDRIGLFWSFVFPVIWYALTVHLNITPGMDAGRPSDVRAVLGISFGVFGAFTVALVGFAGHLSVDLDAKRYRKFRSLPLAPSADLAGRFVSGSALGVVSFALVLLVATADGATYRLSSSTSVLVVLASVVSFCVVAMVVGLLATLAIPDPRHATTVGTGVLIVVFLVTGYNGLAASVFPGDGRLLNLLPNSLSTRLIVLHLTDIDWMLAGLSPPGSPGTPAHASILVGHAIGLSIVGVTVMKRYVYGADAGE